MSWLSTLFAPKPKACVLIRNFMGEVIDRIEGVYDLIGVDLSNRNLDYGDFRKLCLAGANLQNTTLFGARLDRVDCSGANLNGAYLAFAQCEGTNFSNCDLRGASFYRAEIGWPRKIGHLEANFRGAKIDPLTTDIRLQGVHKDKPTPRKKVRVFVRPRALLLLSETGWQWKKYEQSPRKKQRGMSRRRSRFPKREAQCSN